MQDVIVLPRSAAKQPEPYRGHDIILTEKFMFAVVLDDMERPSYCSSLIEAHATIDEYLRRKSKQAKAKETVKLPYAALGRDHELYTGIVRGFHATQGHILTDGTLGDASTWYPDNPEIRRRLKELGELRMKVADIERNLRAFSLSSKPVYGRTDSSRYDDVLAGIVRDYEKRRVLAEEAHQAAIRTA